VTRPRDHREVALAGDVLVLLSGELVNLHSPNLVPVKGSNRFLERRNVVERVTRRGLTYSPPIFGREGAFRRDRRRDTHENHKRLVPVTVTFTTDSFACPAALADLRENVEVSHAVHERSMIHIARRKT
jgi:hypothetical protein